MDKWKKTKTDVQMHTDERRRERAIDRKREGERNRGEGEGTQRQHTQSQRHIQRDERMSASDNDTTLFHPNRFEAKPTQWWNLQLRNTYIKKSA